ncbi:hypothetical protein CAPTEDRAFT_215746 [Capitella teleta]|uniref:Major facilitator superfamily (MFS) profile domain-containing protein n=1 Tax=Capitella teleta TaxID=283909 RepID=R7VB87_CAPTE|nr:hypothetical protein CAPTEDRAFT_215746 [Capitella teleta]|eukprot:ELU15802.1 hypothetical protein CAPTEDRAFT_215746 [Capitella teleta]
MGSPGERLPQHPVIHPRHHAIALQDLPDELRQSISSLGSAHVPLEDVQSLGKFPPFKQESTRSWAMLVICFTFQSLYGLAAFSPPVYYVTYVEYFQITKSVGAWVGSVYLFCCFMIGMVASTLIGHYGCRTSTFCGSLCLFAARAVSSYSPNIITIYVFQSVFSGFGAGTTFIGVNVILPKYFGKHRALASIFALSGMGVGMGIAPILITYLIKEFGWRGAVLIEAAVLAHMLPLSLTFVDPTPAPLKTSFPPESEKQEQCCASVVHFVKSSFNFSMLKDKLFAIYCLSNLMARVNSSTLVCHLPSYVVSEGYTLDEAAFVASISGGCCVAARFLASCMGLIPKVDHLVVYGVVMLLNSLSSVLFLLLPGLNGKSVAGALFGFAFGFDYPFVPVILVQIMGVELLARAMAIYNLISLATVLLVVPPIVGLVYDVTGSYSIPLLTGAAACSIGCFLSFAASYLLRKRLRNESNEISLHEKPAC